MRAASALRRLSGAARPLVQQLFPHGNHQTPRRRGNLPAIRRRERGEAPVPRARPSSVRQRGGVSRSFSRPQSSSTSGFNCPIVHDRSSPLIRDSESKWRGLFGLGIVDDQAHFAQAAGQRADAGRSVRGSIGPTRRVAASTPRCPASDRECRSGRRRPAGRTPAPRAAAGSMPRVPRSSRTSHRAIASSPKAAHPVVTITLGR